MKCDATISGVSGMGGKGTAGGEPLANEDNIDGTSSDGSNIGPDCANPKVAAEVEQWILCLVHPGILLLVSLEIEILS